MATDTTALDSLSPIKRALLEIRDLKAKLNNLEQAKAEPIAIVGMGLRLPGSANDPERFWQLLREGVDAICPVPADRWDAGAYYDPDPTAPGKMQVRGGGFIDDVDRFDASFFGISPREANSMDPQQRLLLEVSWEALEHAGQAPDKLHSSQTGVFFGLSNSDYFRLAFPDPANTELYPVIGNAFSVAAGRLSYTLGLHGPSISLDTACSSSLVALHLACQSLRSRECDMALAGGVNLILTPEISLNFSKAQMMAANDHCKTFDAAADGYVRGEGCGVIVLKRLSDALANGDHILAQIRGSAVNQDGRSSGLTAPNGPAQEAVIRQALANAGVEPYQVSYLETHGTGTPLGDPIEVHALAKVLGQDRSPDNPLRIGSIKTNIGHLEAAAGIAGLIKVVLSLQHQEIPPHLNLQVPNPHIAWDKIPVVVATERMSWSSGSERRFAGVSSFGFSGTNAHVILEEAPLPRIHETEERAQVERPRHLLTLSAKREIALNQLAGRFETYLAGTVAPFSDICFTTNTGRAHLNYRLAVVAGSAAEAREKLAAFQASQELDDVLSGQVSSLNAPEIAFLFTGHGAQYVQMGRQLYQTQPTFRAIVDKCDDLLRSYMDRPLLKVLYPIDPDEAGLMDKMTYAQPALFVLEYALAVLWRSWGIEPAVVMGHSVGEYVAACVAGIFSLEDGLKLVATRGRLMDSLPETGEMAAVFADETRVTAAIAPYAAQVAIAAINGPQSLVISGASSAIQTILAELQAEGIKTRRLAIAQAAHSPLLDPILAEFEKIAAEVRYSPPQIGLISGLTGKPVAPTEATNPIYWRRHLRQPVQFARGMEMLHREGYKLFVEIGPHPTLLGMGRRCLPETEETSVWLPSLRQGWDDWQQILESLAALYVQGANIDWAGFDRDYLRRRLPLPTYPWVKERYWLERISEKHSLHAPQASSLWETALTAGQRQAGQAPLKLAVQSYPAKWQALERLTIAYIAITLRELGVFTNPGESHTLETLLARTGVLPTYEGLLGRWLERLVAAGLLQQQAEQFISPTPLPEADLAVQREEARETLADLSPLQAYVDGCGAKLIPVLTGQESPLETLFPDGSFDITDYLYHHWPLVAYCNDILQAVIEAAARNIPAGKLFRLLEIGAGTGGTTAALLPVLPPDRTLYQYTDVSELFLARAEERFKAYPFVRYSLLNAEQDPQAQGYPQHSFDIVVAANALHATRNLPETLTHVRSLLAPGGLLLLFEVTEHLAWYEITTSLIEGWARFEDGLRQDHPLLAPEQWQAVLQENGFEQVLVLPEADSPAAVLRHHILIAQAPQVEIPLDGGIAAPISVGPERVPGDRGTQVEPTKEDTSAEFIRLLTEALPDERQELLIDYTRTHVARILRLPPTPPVGRRERLLDLGLDSLMAVELRGRLGTGLGLKRSLPATLVFDYPTIEAIADYLAREIITMTKPANGTVAEAEPLATLPVNPQLSAAINELSDEEVEALLLKKLANI
jgi:acyl transferase domain-containing protein/SAM-dependent methyltransferase